MDANTLDGRGCKGWSWNAWEDLHMVLVLDNNVWYFENHYRWFHIKGCYLRWILRHVLSVGVVEPARSCACGPLF